MYLDPLNPSQRRAVEYGCADLARKLPGPLLIIAGAGTGKTNTLAHRVAHLIVKGADPRRILLLTFTRRAAAEMTRRAERIVGQATGAGKRTPRVEWSGTFHGIANRLLRVHAKAVSLDPSFTVLDQSDGADLMNLVRDDLGFSQKASRFPKKGTCFAIYSHTMNSRHPLEETLERAFPWCSEWADELNRLFQGYVEAKQQRHVLDFDDLLLYWFYLMQEPATAEAVQRRFDHVLVDEYQDTNALQVGILLGLKPDGRSLSVVGDDAQSIYSFRAATVKNILEYPGLFQPPAEIVTLEQNYRSTQPILDAANAVISGAGEQFTKQLFSTRRSAQQPVLVTAENEQSQVDYIVERILEHREAGVDLKRQAVLMRASHHSDLLEIELGLRNIPFVKFGGLKFLETAHVKDVICVLRWAENPHDAVAGFRVVQLLPGMGPAHARRLQERLEQASWDFGSVAASAVPSTAREDWAAFTTLMQALCAAATDWQGQLGMVRRWYAPHLHRLYDAAQVRANDLELLEQIASTYRTRERFLSELTLDPPQAVGDESGVPSQDEDYLILSTIHSAKGQEWDVVYVLNVVDGCIPSDRATGTPEEIDEERRLLYVAMTRARDQLHLVHPHRLYIPGRGDAHLYPPRTRFIDDAALTLFERRTHGAPRDEDEPTHVGRAIDVAARLRELWVP
ncbi:MAG: ATP-dependent helicase [Gemmatimonadetes bacterium]|nr:ATP-dependent helicase [Gemmatimonadota bacterium]